MPPKSAKKPVKIPAPPAQTVDRIKMEARIVAMTPEELAVVKFQITELIYWWLGTPIQSTIDRIRADYPFLSEFIQFEAVYSRVENLALQQPDLLGVSFEDFFPELVEFRNRCLEAWAKVPKNLEKAALWLLPFAQGAGANSDVEAAVYFASRSNLQVTNANDLKKSWHRSICRSITRGVPITDRLTDDVRKRAEAQLISLSEAAAILSFHESLPRFFSFADNEREFIDASFFRAVEWFGLEGFEPWIESFCKDVSDDIYTGMDATPFSWSLIFLCRSDIALRKIEHFALESLLWSLCNGQIERNKPWRQYVMRSKEYKIIDYIPILASIIFSWHRIKPQQLNAAVLHAALDELLQHQLHDGAWPDRSDDINGSIVSTCFAIHALALAKPTDWEKACLLAKNWLLDKQEESGCWHEEGGPTVMLTVLTLDAISLATGTETVTFGRTSAKRNHESAPPAVAEPTYSYTGQPWYNPPWPEFTSKTKPDASKDVKPKLGLVVATEAEIRQGLHLLKPLTGKRKIWKVTHDQETFYIGRLGAFDTVLTMCTIGAEGVAGSALTIDSLIKMWKVKAVVLTGIAFGAAREKQGPADVLIAESVIPYESQRVGAEIKFKSPIPPASSLLINRFRNALGWKFGRPDKTNVATHFGPVLSGAKLIDNIDLKSQLLNQFPSAIGGEMEGSGLTSSALRNRTEWILVKGVCDWADGHKHSDYQQMAAASAISLCQSVFTDPHALNGLGKTN
jgi:nucleoside phosphorylase